MIDLHLHLDGSLPPEIVPTLAGLAKVPLPENLEAALKVPADCQDLNDCLRCFELPLALLQSGEALQLAAYELGRVLATQGLLYAEVRFAPQLHTRHGLRQEQAVQAVLAGLAQAEKESPDFHSQAILCCMRGGGQAENQETIELTAQYLGQGVCAADLAGAEGLYPTADYRNIFARAKDLGLPFTIHAGEAAGPESVRTAVELGAARIGHGVHALADEALTDLLAEREIPLELCFTSNLQTKAVASPEEFPLRAFLQRGVRATLNTDNLTVSDTTLREEFAALAVTPDERRTLLENSAHAAFLPESGRKALLQSVRERLERSRQADQRNGETP